MTSTVTYRQVLALAWPASVASSITPLLGVVDVWALAHSARPLDVAAVGLGAVIFSLVYWTFGFIRMSVAGLTAQAAGARNPVEERAALARGALIGAAIGLLLVLLQAMIAMIAFPLLGAGSEASAETLAIARAYFEIRIWGAPAAIAANALFGWLTAKGRTDYLMAVSILVTALNIALDYWFVVGLGWGAKGVAAGTLIAEAASFGAGAAFIAMVIRRESGLSSIFEGVKLLEPTALAKTISVNRDIFIRTLLLAFSFSWFIQRGGAFGDVTLAANQIVMQLFLFTGLALDGTAIAAETLVGRAIGDENRARGAQMLRQAIRITFVLALAAAVAFTGFYALFGGPLIDLLTPPGPIRDAAATFLIWAVVSPVIVVIGFQLDGIFIGATRAREMRNSMIVSVLIFLPLSIWLAGQYGNHGLWAAFMAYFAIRGATLAAYLPGLLRRRNN